MLLKISFIFEISPSLDNLKLRKPGPATSIFSKWSTFFNNRSLILLAKSFELILFVLAKIKETLEDKSKLKTVHEFAEEFCKLFDNELKNNGKIFKA